MQKNWNAPTTPQALRASVERERLIINNTVPLRLDSDRVMMKGDLAYFQSTIVDKDPQGVRVIVDKIYPVWLDEMAHEQARPISNWLMLRDPFASYEIYAAVGIMDRFFEVVYNQDNATVERYIANVETFIRFGVETDLINRYMTTNADLSLLSASKNRRGSLEVMMDGLEQGFSHTHLKNISPNFYRYDDAKTPQFLDYLLKNHPYEHINGVVALTRSNAVPKLTNEWTEKLLDAGFTHSRQVTTYASNLHIRPYDPDYYKKLADVRKRANSKQDAVLSMKDPDIKELARVILQVL